MNRIYSEIGLKPALEPGIEGAHKGLSSASSYAGKTAGQGNEMAAIHRNRNYFPEHAKSVSRTKEPGLRMNVVPKTRVSMQIVETGRVDIFA